jgi:hypothetical protein
VLLMAADHRRQRPPIPCHRGHLQCVSQGNSWQWGATSEHNSGMIHGSKYAAPRDLWPQLFMHSSLRRFSVRKGTLIGFGPGTLRTTRGKGA